MIEHQDSTISLSGMRHLREETSAAIETQREVLTKLNSRLEAIDSVIRGLSALGATSDPGVIEVDMHAAPGLPHREPPLVAEAQAGLANTENGEGITTTHPRQAVKTWALRLLSQDSGAAYTVDEMRVLLEKETGDAPSKQTMRRAMRELVRAGSATSRERDGRSSEYLANGTLAVEE